MAKMLRVSKRKGEAALKKRNKLSPIDVYVLDIQQKLMQQRNTHMFHSAQRGQEEPIILNQQLNSAEEQLVQQISDKTHKKNINNIVRTEAYLSFFLNNSEIHWAFLAHAVSRNAGWNMTDLKGGLLPRLLQEHEVHMFFKMLERCNWLIFQDAYPQLLIYAESKKQGRPLFHLLPHFHVSAFMQVIWEWYWEQRNILEENDLSRMITYALIINEQNYIEQRVIQDPFYREHVLTRFTFLLQSFLHFNHIYFPYAQEGLFTRNERRIDHLISGAKPILTLAGTVVTDFTNLQERIKVGKTLYSILFESGLMSVDIQSWFLATQHTGSRVDYWPQIFTGLTEEESSQFEKYQFHLKENQLHRKSPPIYSPQLEDVWPDQEHPPAEQGDWYKGHLIHSWFTIEKNHSENMTKESLAALNRIEAAIVAKETF